MAESLGTRVKKAVAPIGGFFTSFALAVKKGDIFVKLSLLIMGLGHIVRKRVVSGIALFLTEIGYCLVFGQVLHK